MSLAQLILLLLNVSLVTVVFALGLNASPADLTHLLRRPGLLARSLLSMNVLLPLFAALAAALLDVIPAVKIAILALALSPVPPVLPAKQTKAGGTASYAVGLLATAAALAIVIVPLGVYLLGRAFGGGREISMRVVLPPLLITVISPLVVGMIVGRLAPGFAARFARPLSKAGSVLMLLVFVPIMIKSWSALVAVVGDGTLLLLALFTLVGVAVGHLLGGPDPDDRTVLALATGTRHPGVALAVAGATFPDEKAVLAVVLWHLVISGVVTGPYVKWRQRSRAAAAG